MKIIELFFLASRLPVQFRALPSAAAPVVVLATSLTPPFAVATGALAAKVVTWAIGEAAIRR